MIFRCLVPPGGKLIMDQGRPFPRQPLPTHRSFGLHFLVSTPPKTWTAHSHPSAANSVFTPGSCVATSRVHPGYEAGNTAQSPPAPPRLLGIVVLARRVQTHFRVRAEVQPLSRARTLAISVHLGPSAVKPSGLVDAD